MFFKNAFNFLTRRRKTPEDISDASDESKDQSSSEESRVPPPTDKKVDRIRGDADKNEKKKGSDEGASNEGRNESQEKIEHERMARKKEEGELIKVIPKDSSEKVSAERLAFKKGSDLQVRMKRRDADQSSKERKKEADKGELVKVSRDQLIQRKGGDESVRAKKRRGDEDEGKQLMQKKGSDESARIRKQRAEEEESKFNKLKEVVDKKKELPAKREDGESAEIAKAPKEKQLVIPKNEVQGRVFNARRRKSKEGFRNILGKTTEDGKRKLKFRTVEQVSSREKRLAQKKPDRPIEYMQKGFSKTTADETDSKRVLKKSLIAKDSLSREKSTRSKREKRKTTTTGPTQAEETQEEFSRRNVRAKKSSSGSQRERLKRKLFSKVANKGEASRDVPNVAIPEMYRKKFKKKPQEQIMPVKQQEQFLPVESKGSSDSVTDYWINPDGKPKKPFEICEIPSEGEDSGYGKIQHALAQAPPQNQKLLGSRMDHAPQIYGVADRPQQQQLVLPQNMNLNQQKLPPKQAAAAAPKKNISMQPNHFNVNDNRR